MKYDNTLQVMYRFLFIFYLGLLVFYASTGYSSNGEFGYFVCIALFVFCLIFLTFIFIKYKHVFHYTYFLEDKVEQKFLLDIKQIAYKDVRYIYLIGNCAFLAKEKEVFIENRKYSLRESREIISKLKHNVVISLDNYRGGNNNAKSLIFLQAKCANSRFIKVGELPKHIENVFDI